MWDEDDTFNRAVDEAIAHLTDDNANSGAEALQSLAEMWAKAGLPQSNFLQVREYVINEAVARTSAPFIQEKLLTAERALQERRNGNRIITNLTSWR